MIPLSKVYAVILFAAITALLAFNYQPLQSQEKKSFSDYVSAVTPKITYINSAGIGKICVKIVEPKVARYADGAPVLVGISTSFTPGGGFNNFDVTSIGGISIGYLWPGVKDLALGVQSEGTDDYGGPLGMKALRDVLLFATGKKADIDGKYLKDLVSVTPLTSNTGLYAFSHPGIAATNIMAMYGSTLTDIKYIVGRENPTIDILCAVEAGYWNDTTKKAVFNPLYKYPENYGSDTLKIDYSRVAWIKDDTYPEGRPAFIISGKPPHILSNKCPTMWGRRFYSRNMLHALYKSAFPDGKDWPADLATPEEADTVWPYRETVKNYPKLKTQCPNLKVMLVFGNPEHIQPSPDAPNIHQAFSGFRGAGLWVRMNPDKSYQLAADSSFKDKFPDNPANTEPADWSDMRTWSYPAIAKTAQLISAAGCAEMMDRVHENNWATNLDDVIFPLYREESPAEDELVFVPSDAGGTEGIFVEIKKPAKERYAGIGAPIAINIMGGSGGSMDSIDKYDMSPYGFISLRFNFPGSGVGTKASGGTYDTRGPNCLLSLRDVINFCLGKTKDTKGRYISEIVSPIVPLYENTGLVGWSNGGNSSTCVTGVYGQDISELAWICNWESPVGDGMTTVEAGTNNGGVNPKVNPAYSESTGKFDYTKLKYSPTLDVTVGPAKVKGGLYYEINGDTKVDPGIDYILTGSNYNSKVYNSLGVIENAYSGGILPASPPSHIPTLDEARDFWKWRNGQPWIDSIVKKIPDIMFIVEASDRDHVQSPSNFPHIQNQYLGFVNAKARFARLNPDRSYVELIAGKSIPTAVDNDAFMLVDNSNVKNYLEPSGPTGVLMYIGVSAAVCELADRTLTNNTSVNLSSLINAVGEESSSDVIKVYPNPFNSSVNVTISINKPDNIYVYVYNLLGEQVNSLGYYYYGKGTYNLTWDGRDSAGRQMPSGVYRITLICGIKSFSEMVVLSK